MKHIAVFSAAVLVALVGIARAAVDTLEDIGADCTPVTTRIIDGVTVTISTSMQGVDVTARTYNVDECNAFLGADGGVINTPLNPENVSGTRFISSGGGGTGLGFSETQPIIFAFDAPVIFFGLTTVDLLEPGCNPSTASLTLRAYDASRSTVDEHTRVGSQGLSGLDLDWFVSGNQIVEVELTGTDIGDCGGHGIDDLMLIASTAVDDLEDIGADCTPVTTRIIDGVTVTISTSMQGVDVTARTYNVDECNAFLGDGGESNAPLNPANVSGTRFISSAQPTGFPEVEPIIFEFGAPVALFGLTTLDLLEDGPACNPGGANLALRAYDASDALVDEHARTGGQGPGGLDLDWFVSGNQIVRVELTGGDFGECTGYGIDDLVLVSADCDGDGFPNDKDACPCVPAPAGVDAQGRPLGDLDFDCDVDLHDHAIMQQNFTGPH